MTDKDLSLTEFSIIELEDRLEFAELCDSNCGCNTGGTNTTCNPSGGGGITVPIDAYCGGGGGGGTLDSGNTLEAAY